MKYLDTFTGYGGFTLGIQRAYEKHNGNQRKVQTKSSDVEHLPNNRSGDVQEPISIGYSEIDKYATSVYQKHFPTHKAYGDITQINPQSLPDFDLLTGGFPCQAFSIAGKRRGFEDTRGTLFFDIARILREKKPRWVVLENVKGLLSHDNGRTFKTIISTLVELGYGVEWQVLNAKNYGVPQNRERVFIVGNLGGERTGQVFPLGEDGESADELPRHVANTITRRYEQVQATGTYIGEGQRNAQGTSGQGVLEEGIKPDNSNRRGGETYPSSVRRLTPTECERLMGLPDGWTARGKKGEEEVEISDSQRYKLCGNGVVVNVVEAVISKIISLTP